MCTFISDESICAQNRFSLRVVTHHRVTPGAASVGYPQDALLLINTSGSDTFSGAETYLIAVGDELVIRRINRRTDSRYDLLADDPNLPKETLDSEALAALLVAGRVIWTGQPQK